MQNFEEFVRRNDFMFEYDEIIRTVCESKNPEITEKAVEVADFIFDHNDWIDTMEELCKCVLGAFNYSDFCEFLNLDEKTVSVLTEIFTSARTAK